MRIMRIMTPRSLDANCTDFAFQPKDMLYMTSKKGKINIVSPKAHGIGYFFPPTDEKLNGEEDGDPQWWYDCWQFIILSELWEIKHPGEPFSAKAPQWFNLPTMMRFKVNTPNTLHQLKNSVRPYNFIFIPRTHRDERKEKKKFTLITPFTKDRSKWLGAKCRRIAGIM